MVKTKVAESFFLNAVQQEAKILYSRVENVNFNIIDKMIVVYIDKGYIETFTHELTEEETTRFVSVAKVIETFEQTLLKSLIEESTTDFNSIEENKNLLVSEIVRISDVIIMGKITENNGKFFGISVEKWEIE